MPGGIRVKLALALLAIVGGVLAVAYAIVIPTLEQGLVSAKLDQMQANAESLAVNYSGFQAQNNFNVPDFVDSAGVLANSRVVLFSVSGGGTGLDRARARLARRP